MKTTTIRQGGMFPLTPRQIYEIWLDSKKHGQLIGGKAVISPKVGGRFKTFNGWAEGKNVELVLNKKIVQTWRGSDWPGGHYSTLTLRLMAVPGKGTKLLFTQTGVPAGLATDIAKGWREYYPPSPRLRRIPPDN